MFNTNTNKLGSTTFPIAYKDNHCVPELNLQQVSIAGASRKASQITRLPLSRRRSYREAITHRQSHWHHQASVLHALPRFFSRRNQSYGAHLCRSYRNLSIPPDSPIDFTSTPVLDSLEAIRQHGARLMSLDPTAQAQPKIAIPSDPTPAEDNFVHVFSMGVLHKAVPMTVGLCVGVAAGIKGSLAWEIVTRSRSASDDKESEAVALIRVGHPSGTVDVGAEFGPDGDVTRAKVVRTGRRLMKGVVWW